MVILRVGTACHRALVRRAFHVTVGDAAAVREAVHAVFPADRAAEPTRPSDREPPTR
jgi:hypothetical protein